jgi:hypothetical protein
MQPSLRQPFRHAASMLTTIACLGLIAAAHTGFGFAGMAERGAGERVDVAMDETTGSVGPIGRRRGVLPLSDEQRARIFDSVMRIPDAPVADVPPPEIAQALPQSVPLQDLPAGVAREVPQVEGHKFVKFDDRILVINPANRVVVAMIPRYKLLP